MWRRTAHVLQVAHFELAIIAIPSSDSAVTVRFTCDPQPLLASLAAGSLPAPINGPKGIVIRIPSGSDLSIEVELVLMRH
jgi:hypothetical protein